MFRLFFELIALLRAISRTIAFYQGSPIVALQRVFRVWRREGVEGVRRRANILLGGLLPCTDYQLGVVNLYDELIETNSDFFPKISIIVPNYNHEIYLRQRLDTIYNQTYRNIEVILLDDCSMDGSVAILQEYAQRYPEITICDFNSINSGGVFHQWRKGFELANGELIWIAESDDFSTVDFLEQLVGFFNNDSVRLAFGRTEFVMGNTAEPMWNSDAYLSDLKLDIWKTPFIKPAHALVKSAWVVKNIIPNVSGALFRRPRSMPLLTDGQWANLRMCGDWIFYLSIIRGGLVAYNPEATNYYRQHPDNTSANAQKEKLYYREHQIVSMYLAQLYKLDREDFERQQRQLYLHWCARNGNDSLDNFNELFDLEKILSYMALRKPNIAMCVYALAAGGGETFPIILANQLGARGYSVTLLNCHEAPTEPGVKEMLSGQIPILDLKQLQTLASVFAAMGIEVVHSHHAWVDVSLATLLAGNSSVSHVVTMHGMYEMMTPSQLKQLLPLLKQSIDRFVYSADKNTLPFDEEFRKAKGFCKIHNSLPVKPFSSLSRADLGIGEHDFVLCLVARAIAEKGWQEAIESVLWANARSSRKIHLLLVGDGPEARRLKAEIDSDLIHFLGFRSNIRDYFAAADMGFLPSKFAGESFPLVLIDCLLAGRPVLASRLGEIPYMLSSDEGAAGDLFDLVDTRICVEAVGVKILKFSDNKSEYINVLNRVPFAAQKFDLALMVDKYEQIYSSACSTV